MSELIDFVRERAQRRPFADFPDSSIRAWVHWARHHGDEVLRASLSRELLWRLGRPTADYARLLGQ